MRKANISAIVGAMFMVSAISACAGEKQFKIDPAHSSLTFRIRHLYTMFTGRFNSFSGVISGDPDNPATMKVEAEVDLAGVDTANKDRDDHLRAADFFDVKLHPTARFESTKIVADKENKGTVIGNMTIRGITKEVAFDGGFLGHGIDHRGGQRAGFHAEAKINRSDFGISYNATLPNGITVLGEEVELNLDIEAIESQPESNAEKAAAQQVNEPKSESPAQLTEEAARALEEATAQIAAKGDVDGLKVGSRAPDFSLPDTEGKIVKLSEQLKKGPAVVVFYRGEWCAFCNLQQKALEEAYPRIKALGASLIGISPQTQEKAIAQQDANKLSYSLLADATGKTMRDYRLLYQVPESMKKVFMEQYKIDLEEYNGPGRWELPVTATYVIDAQGVIKAGLVDMDYTRRMDPKEIIKALEEIANP